jgi:hypothetical protein
MVADGATCGSTENAMMTRKMPCNAAHQGAFNTAFSVGWCRYGDKCYRDRGASKGLDHLVLLSAKTSRSSSNNTGDQKVPLGTSYRARRPDCRNIL